MPENAFDTIISEKCPAPPRGARVPDVVRAVIPDFKGGWGEVGESSTQRRRYIGHDFSGR